MEIGPDVCIWPGGLTESCSRDAGSRCSNSVGTHHHHHHQFRPHPVQSFHVPNLSNIVLELESDEESILDSWEDEPIQFTTNVIQVDDSSRSTVNEDMTIPNETIQPPPTEEEKEECYILIPEAVLESDKQLQSQEDKPIDIPVPRVKKKTAVKRTVKSIDQPPALVQEEQTVVVTRHRPSRPPTQPQRTRSSMERATVTRELKLRSKVQPTNEAVICPVCNRTFCNLRSQKIHSTKAHSGKRSKGATTQRTILPKKDPEEEEEEEPTIPELVKVDDTVDNSPQRLVIDESINPECEEASNDTIPIKSPTCTIVDKPSVGEVASEEEKEEKMVVDLQLRNSPSPLPSHPSTMSETGSIGYARKRIAYAVSPSSLTTSDMGCLKLRLVSVPVAKRPRCSNSPSMKNERPIAPQTSSSPHGSSNKVMEEPVSIDSPADIERQTFCEAEKTSELMDSRVSENTTPSFEESYEYQPVDIITMDNIPNDISTRPTDSPTSTISYTPESSSLVTTSPIPGEPDQKTLQKSNSNCPIMDTSLRTPDGSYTCRLCQRVFPSRLSLTGHYKSHYVASQKPYYCDDCGQRYTSRSNLHYHRSRNCPVLKLRALNDGGEVTCSARSLKLIETRAKQGEVRRANLEQENSSTNHYDTEESNQDIPKLTKSSTQTHLSENHLKENEKDSSLPSDKSRGTKNGFPTSHHTPPLSDSHGTTSMPVLEESSEPAGLMTSRKTANSTTPRSKAKVSNSTMQAHTSFSSLATGKSNSSSLNTPHTDRDKPSSNRMNNRACNSSEHDTEGSSESLESFHVQPVRCVSQPTREPEINPTSSNSVAVSLQVQLRNLLEHACQSDVTREKILAFTSAALLSALSPVNSSFKNQTNRTAAAAAAVTSPLRSQIADLLSPSNFLASLGTSIQEQRRSAFDIPSSSHSTIRTTPSTSPPSWRSTMSSHSSPPPHPPLRRDSVISNESIQQQQQPMEFKCRFCDNHHDISFPDAKALSIHILSTHAPQISTNVQSTRRLSDSTLIHHRHSSPTPLSISSVCSQADKSTANSRVCPTQSTVPSPYLIERLEASQHSIQSLHKNPPPQTGNKKSRRYSEYTIAEPVNTNKIRPGSHPPSQVQCHECDRVFSSNTAYRVHRTKTHRKETINSINQPRGSSSVSNNSIGQVWHVHPFDPTNGT